ncbi:MULTISPECIES: ABC transporter substrate-binding protein [Paenibacillus]|uniref:Amino acid/amide ABC transporter substrate-binding protein, HAAT family n=1 Tax=Paenibacillus typhae TaxID=1174501 RepID=A0A1G9HHS6_9BACL|nr:MULTISPECIES: ABC transporter substrate-binding protein [Paenibacillus]KUP25326.1 ethanolamine utilization protein EutJ [Paenibacillus sp. DMB5]MBY0013271.1 ABC transporter substrate-binding protein [Paenibacillus typhae]SDL12063.1 amino acid/amide ABC transporter substrate-binding protein, HAAT family [Paenibacillus typhae]
MKKIGAIILSTVLTAVLASGCGSNNTENSANSASGGNAAGDTIKIGADLELTGGQASFGDSASKGAQLAVDQINAAGGILGKQLELVVADNASKSEEATQAAQKLITNDKVVTIIGASTSTNTLGIVPVATEKKIPLVAVGATNPKVTVDERSGDVNEWVFRAAFIDPFQGQVMANFASNNLSAKTAVIYTDTSSDYSKGLQKFFEETFKANGGEILSQESYQQKDSDFKAVLTRIKEANPDVIYLPGYYEEVGKIVKQAREMGITVPFLGGDGWDSPQLAEIAGAAALENTYMSNHYSPEDTATEVTTFVDAYKEANGGAVPDGMAALGYDALKLVADAITRAGEADPAKIKDALAATKDLQLATGKITLNETHDPVKAAVVLKFVDGVQTFEAKVNP